MLDVYPARERAEDFPGVSAQLVVWAADDRAHWWRHPESAPGLLREAVRAGRRAAVHGRGGHRPAGPVVRGLTRRQDVARPPANHTSMVAAARHLRPPRLRARAWVLLAVLLAAAAFGGVAVGPRLELRARRAGDGHGGDGRRGAGRPPGARAGRARDDDAARRHRPAAQGGGDVPAGQGRPRRRRPHAPSEHRGHRAPARRRPQRRRQAHAGRRRRHAPAGPPVAGRPAGRQGAGPARRRPRSPAARRSARSTPSPPRRPRCAVTSPACRSAGRGSRRSSSAVPRILLGDGVAAPREVDRRRRASWATATPRAPPTSTCACPSGPSPEGCRRARRPTRPKPRPPLEPDPDFGSTLARPSRLRAFATIVATLVFALTFPKRRAYRAFSVFPGKRAENSQRYLETRTHPHGEQRQLPRRHQGRRRRRRRNQRRQPHGRRRPARRRVRRGQHRRPGAPDDATPTSSSTSATT